MQSYQRGFEKINEAYSTEICSCCRSVLLSGPRGRSDLRVRGWFCAERSTEHHRDKTHGRKQFCPGTFSSSGRHSCLVVASEIVGKMSTPIQVKEQSFC